jgi:histidinol-phosphate aminotransferase
MEQQRLDRRQWLRTAGLAGAFAFMGGWPTLGEAATDDALAGPLDVAGPNKLVPLSSNENPFGPSPKVREAMAKAFDEACRYPHAFAQEFTQLVAEKEGVPADHIVVTAGSIEGLRISGLAYCWQGGEVVAPDPTFLALLTYAELFGAHIHRVPLDEDLQHDLEAMEKRITSNTRLVFVCNPNNPTGALLPAGKLRDFCATVSRRTVVFSDEAYYDYVEEPGYPSMVELVKEGLNVIVSRTFSKVYGLAGMRIGYLVARPDIAARLRQTRAAYNNILGLHAARAALLDETFYRYSLQKNAESRQLIYTTLDELGLRYVRSHANFVFFESGRDIAGLVSAMEKEGIRIGRPFPPLRQWCRISTGTMEDTALFCEALKRVI